MQCYNSKTADALLCPHGTSLPGDDFKIVHVNENASGTIRAFDITVVDIIRFRTL